MRLAAMQGGGKASEARAPPGTGEEDGAPYDPVHWDGAQTGHPMLPGPGSPLLSPLAAPGPRGGAVVSPHVKNAPPFTCRVWPVT